MWSSREWCEDQNHREHYRTIGEDQGTITLIGTMTTEDRGGPLWVRRVTNEHFPGPSLSWRNTAGTPVVGQGNWAILEQFGYQLIGGASFGSGLTSNTNAPLSVTYGAVPAKNLINFGLWSPKAWRRYKPLTPKVSTSQFFAELRELPKFFIECRRVLDYFKSLGNAYLNWEFGWKPFLLDLKEFLTGLLKFNDRVKQLIRDNGKPIHRQGPVFKDEASSSTTTRSVGADILLPSYETAAYIASFGSSTACPNSKTVTTTISQLYWFSGTFRYYLAPLGSFQLEEQVSRIIYGLDLTPRLVWELMPWSWLADWFTSLGDSIDNMTEIMLDSLVATYAYTMGHYKSVEETAWSNGLTTARRVLTNEIKAREQSTPYGFGIDTSSFSGRQSAILAALALARS